MPYNPKIHHRRSIRLRGYDYAQAGTYFVTVCAQGRECLFGKIVDGVFQPNLYGQAVAECLAALPDHFTHVVLDISVVMPNHMHTIVMLDDTPDMPPVTLGRVVAYLKYRSTTQINDLRGKLGLRIWQRNYYEHIIRDAVSLSRIRAYIANNALKWQQDQLHPENPSKW